MNADHVLIVELYHTESYELADPVFSDTCPVFLRASVSPW